MFWALKWYRGISFAQVAGALTTRWTRPQGTMGYAHIVTTTGVAGGCVLPARSRRINEGIGG